jgi:hypothetical protein
MPLHGGKVMPARIWISVLLVAVLPAALAAQVRDSTPKPPPVHRTPAIRAITITYTDEAFLAPDTIPAGISTITAINHGKELHQGALVRIDSGHTAAELLTVLKGPAPLPGWATLYGGPQNSGSAVLNLPAGNYEWVCFVPATDGVPHFAKGMVRPLTVSAGRHNAASAPAPNLTVTMTDYTWAMTRPIRAGRQVIRVVVGVKSQPHEFMVLRLPPGKTVQDVMAWVSHPVGLPPAETIEGVAPMQPGTVSYSIITFTHGHYVLLCLVPDAKDGKPHALHGMVKEFTVQ